MAKNPILIAKKDIEAKDLVDKKDLDASDEKRPKNLRANTIPTEGYGLEVDGKMKSQHASSDAAFSAGLELKKKFPVIQVKVFAAKEQTRTIVELPK
jgi:hypothetical protein